MNTNLIDLEKMTFGRQRSWPLIAVLIAVLMVLTSSFSLALSVGDRITATSNVKVRTAPPTLGDTGNTQTQGATGKVDAGPTYGTAGGFSGNWYLIDWVNGTDGWSAEPYLTKLATATVPTVQTAGASGVGSTTATLNATITNNGGASIVDARFEYTSSGFPGTVIYSVPVSGSSFSYSLSGLQPGTTYTFHAYAKNSAGWNSGVNNVTFTTSVALQVPSVQTVPASAVGNTTATLNASIPNNGGAAVTDARFEYTSSSFPGTVIYSVPVSGSSFSYSLSGLQPGTTYTYHAYAKNSAGWNSVVNNVTFTTSSSQSNTVATPTITPGSQNASGPVSVTIACATSGATIRYTLDGSDPLSASAAYVSAFTVSSNATVKARAFKTGMTTSALASATYTIVAGGVTTLSNNVAVSEIGGSANSERFYRISVPAGQSKLEIKTYGGSGDADLYVKRGASPSISTYDYKGSTSNNTQAVTINSPASGYWYIMVQGYGAYSGLSLIASYTGTVGTTPTPVISPGSLNSVDPVVVTISSISGATIRYTTNGSDPISGSTVYLGAFTLSASTTIKARAFKAGMADSAVASASYVISVPTITNLSNGAAVTGLSGAASAERKFKLNVPSGQTKLEIKISGGSGDADLYVKRGSIPTTSSYDYRPNLGGNSETVTVKNPASGDWYANIRGNTSYSGVTLIASYASEGAYVFKLPLPGNNHWRCTTAAGGSSGHSGKNFYSLDFSWRTLNSTWPSNQDIPIFAMHSGKVIPLAFNAKDSAFASNGYSVRIDMNQDGDASTGFISTYIHLKYPPDLSGGSIVPAGTLLGYMGTTGDSTGVHLHFGMRYDGDGSYGTGGQSQIELEKILIEGLKVRTFQASKEINLQPGYYRSSR